MLQADRVGVLGIGGDREAVPAPGAAVQRHEALAGLQAGHEAFGFGGAVNDADLRERTAQRAGAAHILAQRTGVAGQGSCGCVFGQFAPENGRVAVKGCLQVVAESDGQGFFKAGIDVQQVDDGLVARIPAGRWRSDAAQRIGFRRELRRRFFELS